MKKVSIIAIAGTRPEAVKMAPLITALRSDDWADTIILATAQHREMLDQTLALFELVPDIDLNVMTAKQSLSGLTAKLVSAMDTIFSDLKPDAVIAQGDTTTVMSAALVAFYHRVPFCHVEAGLRTGNLYNPFPEEANRIFADRLARYNFAPTEAARENLIAEGVPGKWIYVTGNTVIDALLSVARKDIPLGIDMDPRKKMILVTAHRRENFGRPLLDICAAITELAKAYPDFQFLYPVHPNPNVRDVIMPRLSGLPGVVLCDPLDYGPFVSAMKRAYIILTDSGGVQEEAPALGKPVLVLRNETERPEAVQEGVVKLIGTDKGTICTEVKHLIENSNAYSDMARGASPYGDGKSAARINTILREGFCPDG